MISCATARTKPIKAAAGFCLHRRQWKSRDAAALEALTQKIEAGLGEDADGKPLRVDRESRTVETASGTLPLSPVLDPAWIAAKTKPRKGPSHKPGGRFRKKLANNPFARALETPIRRCANTNVSLPRYFLQDFEVVKHPIYKKPWWMPGQMSTKFVDEIAPLVGKRGDSDKEVFIFKDKPPGERARKRAARLDAEPGTGPDAEPVTEPAESPLGPDAESDAVPEAEADALPEAEADAMPEAEADALQEAEANALPEAEADALPDPESPPDPDPGSSIESDSTPSSEPDLEQLAESDGESSPVSGSQVTAESASGSQASATGDSASGLGEEAPRNDNQRAPITSYALCRKSVIDLIGGRNRKYQAMLHRNGMAVTPETRSAVWRQDMGEMVLADLRRCAVNALVSRSRRGKNERYIQPCDGWEDVGKVVQRGCVLWMPRQPWVGGQQYATFDIEGVKFGKTMVVHNLHWLLGDEELERLRHVSFLFRDNDLLVLKQYNSIGVMRLHLLLWRLQGYLEPFKGAERRQSWNELDPFDQIKPIWEPTGGSW